MLGFKHTHKANTSLEIDTKCPVAPFKVFLFLGIMLDNSAAFVAYSCRVSIEMVVSDLNLDVDCAVSKLTLQAMK